MYISGQPYSNFKAINLTQGKLRVADKTISTTDYNVVLATTPGTFTGERKVYLRDADGSMFIKGYHIDYGTTSIVCNGNIAASGIATTSCSISGVLTSAIVLINATSSAQVPSFVPFGATCQTAGKVLIQYFVGAATAAITTVPISYVILNPQTS